MTKDLSPATIAAQISGFVDRPSGGVVPPLQPSTTFVRDADYVPLRADNIYSRDNSDIVRVAEAVLAKLDHADDALLFPSGMAAIAALFRTLPNNATIILQSGIYWGTTAWVRDFCARRSMTLHEVDADMLADACATFMPQIVFAETPSNPWLKTVDIATLSQAAHAVGALCAIDATAATPALCQPLDHGADIVMHSATKAINGHSDVLAGVLCAKDATTPTWDAIKADRKMAGAVLGPFEAWLLVRGMRTLPLRMDRMSTNALMIATWLSARDDVADVFYPGLASHTGHDIAARQMTGGFGCLLSVLVKGDALAIAGRMQLFHRATSLGGVESLVEHRYTIEPHTGIPENLLRLSIGIEDADDLMADLNQALNG